MGLLDDAIREHLELKRLRGADASEVARLEREALGPARREASEPDDFVEEGPPGSSAALFDAEHAGDHPLAEDETVIPEPGPSTIGQDTAEIDMQTVIEAEPEEAFVEHPAAAATHHDLPTETDHESVDGGEADADEADDVLEETPSFLQETPEHDRLWFEQQPPRDFDFDK